MANLDVVLVLFQKIIFIHVIQGRFVGFSLFDRKIFARERSVFTTYFGCQIRRKWLSSRKIIR